MAGGTNLIRRQVRRDEWGEVWGGGGGRIKARACIWLTWRKNNSSSSWIFLEITCWYCLLGVSWI